MSAQDRLRIGPTAVIVLLLAAGLVYAAMRL